MKRSKIFIAALTILFLAAAFSATPPEKKVAFYSFDSPFCSGCVAGITGIVGQFEGVEHVGVDVENHTIVVRFDPVKTNADELLVSIGKETTFKVSLKMVKNASEVGPRSDT